MNQTLFLMMGLPGAGKTTAARIIEKLTGSIRLTSDEARVMLYDEPTFSEAEHQQLYDYLDDQTEHLLTAGKSVIYDANLNRLKHRREKYKIAKSTGVECKLLVLATPEALAKQRSVLEAEGQENRIFGNLDEAVFERLKAEIEWPKPSEPHIILDGTQLTPQYVARTLQIPYEKN